MYSSIIIYVGLVFCTKSLEVKIPSFSFKVPSSKKLANLSISLLFMASRNSLYFFCPSSVSSDWNIADLFLNSLLPRLFAKLLALSELTAPYIDLDLGSNSLIIASIK